MWCICTTYAAANVHTNVFMDICIWSCASWILLTQNHMHFRQILCRNNPVARTTTSYRRNNRMEISKLVKRRMFLSHQMCVGTWNALIAFGGECSESILKKSDVFIASAHTHTLPTDETPPVWCEHHVQYPNRVHGGWASVGKGMVLSGFNRKPCPAKIVSSESNRREAV